MSHIAVQQAKPGEPMFKDVQALRMACDMLGLTIEERSNFAWFNRSVGDYPLPAGMTSDQLGKNAAFVVRLNDENKAKHARPGTEPYEIGMIADPNNPGCFVPMYDHWMGGFGLEAVVGTSLKNKTGDVTMLCPKLKQHYDMCCDALAAKQVGDQIEFLTAKAAHTKYPQLFPQETADESTWVSIANTDNRIEASR